MDEEEFSRIFDAQLEEGEKLVNLNSQEPVERPKRDPAIEISKWKDFVTKHKESASKRPRCDIITGQSHTCKLHFEELKPINLNEMRVPMIHERSYLICRVVAEPVTEVGVMTLVQDLNDDLEIFSVFNYSCDLDDTKWLGVGTILIIKEPYLKYESHNFVLRVDSSSDLIFVDESDLELLKRIKAEKWYVSETRTTEEIKEAGNKYFESNDYFTAWKLYDRAIRHSPNSAVLHLNKSMSCLKLDYFYEAYKSAEMTLKLNGDREKALFMMGLAAYGMRDWTTAVNHFQALCKEFPENKEVDQYLNKAIDRLMESQTGKYDFASMYKLCHNKRHEFDIADYTGSIKIADIPGKGRGVVTTKEVNKGTLLLVSKAFSTGYIDEFRDKILVLDTTRKKLNTAVEKFNFIRSMENLRKNPQMANEVYSLYAGDLSMDEVILEGVIDTARIEKICINNAFASSYLSETERKHFLKSEYNDSSMLFILPSYINHSCLPNTCRTFFGDVMVVYATRDLHEGEEITGRYVHTTFEYSERNNKCRNHWNFECNCKLCELDRRDDELCTRRTRLFDELRGLVTEDKDKQRLIVKVNQVLEQMRETYETRPKYKVRLIEALTVLFKMYTCMEDIENATKFWEECVDLAGDELQKALNLESITIKLAVWYANLNQLTKAQNLVSKAYEMSFCASKELFKLVYPETSQLLV